MRLICRLATTGAPLGGAGYLLLRLAPVPSELARQLRAPHVWIAEVGTDAAVASIAGALLWLCALWVVIGLTAVWLGRLPGLAGRAGRAIARCTVPVAVQRLVAASAGVSLLLGPATAGAVGQAATGPGSTATAGTMAAPGWPLDQPAATRLARPPTQEGPAQGQPTPGRLTPGQPTSGQPTPDAPTPTVGALGGWPLDPSSGTDPTDQAARPPATPPPQTTPARQPAGPRTTTPRTTTPAAGPAPSPKTTPTPAGDQRAASAEAAVTVRAGDSLWTIAAAELGPAATDSQIAIAWPYWYRANRPLIGRDPNLVRPGIRLSRPETNPAKTGRSQTSQAKTSRPETNPAKASPDEAGRSGDSQPIREGLRP